MIPGDKLPTEQQLSRQFMVNRHTVRRALSYLQEKGLIESTQGRGSYVKRPSGRVRLKQRPRFSESVLRRGGIPRVETIKLETRRADSGTARALDIKIGAQIVFLERRRFIDGDPTAISQHLFSHERVPLFTNLYKKCSSITQTLYDHGISDFLRKRTEISTRLATPQESRLLRLPSYVPLIIQKYVNVDVDGRPLELGESRSDTRVVVEFDKVITEIRSSQ